MSLVGTILSAVMPTVDKFVEDKDKKAELEHEIRKAIYDADIAQIEVNKAEAQSRSVFVAGWRPYIGWGCGTGVLYDAIIRDQMVFWAAYAGHDLSHLPSPDTSSLMFLLTGMLGLGGLRTFEKLKGKAI